MSTISYAQAAQELESILNELESDKLDVDQVVEKAERAKELITICRSKVENAKIAIEKLNSEPRNDNTL